MNTAAKSLIDTASYLIVIGLFVSGLVWISTFGNNEIPTKTAFYGTQVGSFVLMGIFTIPLLIMINWMSSTSKITKQQFAFRLVLLVAFQITLMAYAPNVLKVSEETGQAVGNAIVEIKKGS